MLNHIKFACFLLCISLIALSFGIFNNVQYAQVLSRGNYFFEKTRNHLHVQSIVLKFPDDIQITLEQKDHLWHIKEADGYYADFQKISALIKILRNMSIYRADRLTETTPVPDIKDAFSITTLDTDGQVVDDAHIFPKKDENKFHYALLNQQPTLYQLGGDISLSSHLMDWAKMPLLALKHRQIKSIKTDNFDVSRRFSAEELHDSATQQIVPQIKNLTQHFWYLSAIDIKHALHFDRNKYPLVKSFEITMLDGIIYYLDLFKVEQEYWLNIRLDREKLIEPDALEQMKEHQILYDGWFFKINSAAGEAIVNFIL